MECAVLFCSDVSSAAWMCIYSRKRFILIVIVIVIVIIIGNGTARDALVVPKGIIFEDFMSGMLVGMKERKIFNRKNLKSKL